MELLLERQGFCILIIFLRAEIHFRSQGLWTSQGLMTEVLRPRGKQAKE